MGDAYGREEQSEHQRQDEGQNRDPERDQGGQHEVREDFDHIAEIEGHALVPFLCQPRMRLSKTLAAPATTDVMQR